MDYYPRAFCKTTNCLHREFENFEKRESAQTQNERTKNTIDKERDCCYTSVTDSQNNGKSKAYMFLEYIVECMNYVIGKAVDLSNCLDSNVGFFVSNLFEE